jgi:CheY-like chemotaxis protein
MDSDSSPDRVVDVLVVDDHEDTRIILREYLSAHGYRVREASNGEEAIAELRRACPDVMVLDIRMPKVDGLTVLRSVRGDARLCSLPVLALSAHALPDEMREISEAGTDAYLTKPAEPREILYAVRSLLAGRSGRSAAGT